MGLVIRDGLFLPNRGLGAAPLNGAATVMEGLANDAP
jgi:hypothetical protein